MFDFISTYIGASLSLLRLRHYNSDKRFRLDKNPSPLSTTLPPSPPPHHQQNTPKTSEKLSTSRAVLSRISKSPAGVVIESSPFIVKAKNFADVGRVVPKYSGTERDCRRLSFSSLTMLFEFLSLHLSLLKPPSPLVAFDLTI